MARIERLTGQAAPYITAAYFVLFLAAQASAEFVQPGDLVLPLALAGAVAGIGHLLGWLFTRNPERAALIAVVIVVTFSTMGYVVTPLLESNALRIPGGGWVPIVLVLIVATTLILAIARTNRSVGRVLQAVAWTWLGLSLINLFRSSMLTGPSEPGPMRRSAIATSARPQGQRMPDIYLIIVDKYSGSDVLAAQYHFDNEPFIDFLRQRGFVMPLGARPNYVQTFLSLASMLNLEYLDRLPYSLGVDNPRWADAYPLVENNRLAAFLREHGYRFVFLPTALGVTRRNRYADLQVPDPRDIRPEFMTAWLLTTAAPIGQYFWCKLRGCPPARGRYVPETAAMFDWKFDVLARLTDSTRPQFVFAHLTVPHEPYIYRSDCSHRHPYWPSQDLGPEEPSVRSAYIEQIRCVNAKLSRLVTRLQARSKVPPIILIQGDHGHGLLGRDLPPLSKVAEWQVTDRGSAFAAYAVPGMPDTTLRGAVTPVNALRATLRFVFGAESPPLENATFWSSYDRPYRFARVP